MTQNRKFGWCTLCLQRQRYLLNAFDHDESDIDLPLAIQDLLQLEVSEEGRIPWMICMICVVKLKVYRKFKHHAIGCVKLLEMHSCEDEVLGNLKKELNGSIVLPALHETSISDEDSSDDEIYCHDGTGSKPTEEMEWVHVKNEDSDIETLTSDQICSAISDPGCLKYETANGTESQVDEEEEESEGEDLDLHLSSGSSDECSDNINLGSVSKDNGCEVTDADCGGVVMAPVEVCDEWVGDVQRTLEGEIDPEGPVGTGDHCAEESQLETTKALLIALQYEQRQKRIQELQKICPPCDVKSTIRLNFTPDDHAVVELEAELLNIGNVPEVNISTHWNERRLGLYTWDREDAQGECIASGSRTGERSEGLTQSNKEMRMEVTEDNCTLVGNNSIRDITGENESEGHYFLCNECGHVFASNALRASHMKEHRGAVASVSGVGRMRFSGRNNCKTHKHVQHDMSRSAGKGPFITNGIYFCDTCSKAFGSKGTLRKHINFYHLNKWNYICDICSKDYAQKELIIDHMKQHIKAVESRAAGQDQGGSIVLLSSEGNSLSVQEREIHHSCSVCTKKFHRKDHLRLHMLRHTGERPHACSLCSKAFTQKYILNSHMLIHTGERRHACSLCSKSFFRKHNLTTHMVVHTGERPYCCSVCSTGFSQKYSLKIHMLIHTGEEPHACSVCPEAFRYKSTLKTHMAKHHSGPPEPLPVMPWLQQLFAEIRAQKHLQ